MRARELAKQKELSARAFEQVDELSRARHRELCQQFTNRVDSQTVPLHDRFYRTRDLSGLDDLA